MVPVPANRNIQGHRRKRRRERRNAFIDNEAEVDDDDEDEGEEKDGEEIGDFIDNEPAEELAEVSRFDDDIHHRELDRRREMDAHLDAEEQAEAFKKRYGHRRGARGLGDSAVVPQRLLLPSVNDPSIWAVRCKEGKEREVVFSIMKRIEERATTADELKITAAFERGGAQSVMKGYIYVEARRQTDIMVALDGVMNVYPRTKMILVDIKDMPELFRVTKTPTLEPGAWVRLKRPPKHNGDLAQVLDVTESGLEARVRFIPRIDFGLEDKSSRLGTGEKRKRPFGGASGPRAPQRLFNEVEARKHGYMVSNEVFENGYQVKDIKIQQLQVTDVNPTLEEVTKFASGTEDGTENLDLKALAASLKDSNAMATYLPGDVVEVYSGEQKGVVGKTTHVQGDIVTIDVIEGDLTGQTIEVPIKGLRKRFKMGEHVKVIGGSRFRDEVGMVVKIAEDRVTILTDQTNSEVTVFSKDLREASDSGGQGSLGQYAIHDLVQLDMTTVGCVVKVDRESLVVLDQNGDARQVMPSQISNRFPKRKTAVAADRNGNEIRVEDVVREYAGQQRQGKIMHIHRGYVFLHSNDSTENSGVFVTQHGNLNTIAAKGGRINAADSGPDLNSMNPALKLHKGKDEGKMLPPKTFGRDRALGQTVVVRKGAYKGLLGIVKDSTDTHARVELHTKGKTINVEKQYLSFKDKVTGERIDINGRRPPRPGMDGPGGHGAPSYGGHGGGPDAGSRTPMGFSASPSRTPAWNGGSRSKHTPSYTVTTTRLTKPTAPAYGGGDGGRTPAWKSQDKGGRTPAWRPDGSRTVNPYDGNRTAYGSGSRTPAWQSGAKTPALDSFGSKTPAYYGSSGSDPWSGGGGGGKTPAYSAPTPAANNDSWGFTPGASGGADFDAPTPGAGLSAPTPGALNAPTPGGYGAPTPGPVSAPTPGAGYGGWADSAPTPGAPTPGYFGAPTPAAYGGAPTPAASGPRYTDDD